MSYTTPIGVPYHPFVLSSCDDQNIKNRGHNEVVFTDCIRRLYHLSPMIIDMKVMGIRDTFSNSDVDVLSIRIIYA